MKRYTLLRTFMLFIVALIFCGWSSAHTQVSITKGLKALEQTVCFEPDTTSVLKNPLTGWVMYLGRAWDENFWQTQRYDAMPVNGGDSTVRVSDYAGTCYIRIRRESMYGTIRTHVSINCLLRCANVVCVWLSVSM